MLKTIFLRKHPVDCPSMMSLQQLFLSKELPSWVSIDIFIQHSNHHIHCSRSWRRTKGVAPCPFLLFFLVRSLIKNASKCFSVIRKADSNCSWRRHALRSTNSIASHLAHCISISMVTLIFSPQVCAGTCEPPVSQERCTCGTKWRVETLRTDKQHCCDSARICDLQQTSLSPTKKK